MISLLYVSSSVLAAGEEERQLADIIAVAVPRNLSAGVTGALVHTGTHFAQVLEGERPAVESIMGSILIDPRHTDVSILDRVPLLRRSFPNWGMVLAKAHPHTQGFIDMLVARKNESLTRQAIAGLVRCLADSASARI